MTEEETPWADQIKEARKGNGFLIGSHREMRRLPLYLHKGERILSLVTGSPKYMPGSDSGSKASSKGRGIIVATDERVLFIRDGWVFRNVQDLPYETISSVEFTTSIFFGTLSVFGKGDGVFYDWVGRFAGASFAKIVRQQVSDQNNEKLRGYRPETAPVPLTIDAPLGLPNHPATTAQTNPIAEELRQLKSYLDEGLITQEEYSAKRSQVLAKF